MHITRLTPAQWGKMPKQGLACGTRPLPRLMTQFAHKMKRETGEQSQKQNEKL